MSTLGKRMREARESKGLLQNQLAKMIGARSAGVISNWENDLNKPDIDKLLAICKALNVSVGSLLGFAAEGEFICSPAEQQLIEKYRGLDERGQSAVWAILEHEYRRSVRDESGCRLVARGAAQPAEQLASEDNLAKLNEILDEQFGGDSNETGAQGAD